MFALPLSICQWTLIARTGQSLAKRWLGIRIVKVDGSPVNFASGVALRVWIPQVILYIPIVGGLFGLIDDVIVR